MYLFLLLLAIPTASSSSMGINCEGSFLCTNVSPEPIPLFTTLAGVTHQTPSRRALNDTDIYAPGAHIVCLPFGGVLTPGAICAFAQGQNVPRLGVRGSLIKRKLEQLKDHGCRLCGSVPLAESNDPREMGVLTVNFVKTGACGGVCEPTHYW